MKYKTILADPPWKYNNVRTGGNLSSGSAQKYPVMTTEEICYLAIIKDLRDDDCVLFLWVTVPLLEDGLKVLRAWGFDYKSAIFWRKRSLGMGYWFRGQVEICLVGVRGNIKPFRCQKPNFIESRPERHSKKPDAFYGLIESIAPPPRIELFARQRRQGWDSWGNQLSKDVQCTLPLIPRNAQGNFR